MRLTQRYDAAIKCTEYRLLIPDSDMRKFTSDQLAEWYLERLAQATTITGKLLALTAIASGIEGEDG